MSFKLKGLREKRGAIKAKIEAISQKCHADERGMNTEERAEFDKLKSEWVSVGEQITKAEADFNDFGSILDQRDDSPPPARVPGRDDRSGRDEPDEARSVADHARDLLLARQAWARTQYGIDLTPDQADACKRTKLNPHSKVLNIRIGAPKDRKERFQKRAMTVTTTGGGYLIAEDYSYELEQKLVSYSNVRGVVDEFQTDTGADLPYPTEDDTGNTGELLAINTETAYADPTLASVTFGAYKFGSKAILVPAELLQDSAFDVDGMVFGECGTRIGRIQGSYFTTGSGSGQPHGIVTAAAAGVTSVGATAITGGDLTRLAFSVDMAYRNSPKVGYMMKDDVIGYLLGLLDSAGRPLMRESFRDGVSTLLLNGFPVYPNQFMTGLTSSLPVTATKHVLFGDFSKFKIRDAGVIRLKRLDERWAEKDQTGFVGFARADSRCVNTAAIKYLIQA